jgi:hypothetical protein
MPIGIVTYRGHESAFSPNYDVSQADAQVLDFNNGSTGNPTATALTSGTSALVADLSQPGGALLLDAVAATAGQGMNNQWSNFAVTPDADKRVEFYCSVTVLEKVGQLFFGLAVVDSTLMASHALTNKCIGFTTAAAGTSVLDCVTMSGTNPGNSKTQSVGSAIVINQKYELGIVVRTSSVEFYFDGSLIATNKTFIPTDALCPTIICQAAGTTTTSMVVHEMVTRKAK